MFLLYTDLLLKLVEPSHCFLELTIRFIRRSVTRKPLWNAASTSWDRINWTLDELIHINEILQVCSGIRNKLILGQAVPRRGDRCRSHKPEW